MQVELNSQLFEILIFEAVGSSACWWLFLILCITHIISVQLYLKDGISSHDSLGGFIILLPVNLYTGLWLGFKIGQGMEF